MEKDIMKHGLVLSSEGFTLVELLVVVAIIAILSAAGLITFTNAQQRARDSRRTTDISALGKAFEQYYADNSSNYPLTATLVVPNYIKVLPLDPKTGAGYTYGALTSTTYCICAMLERLGTGNATNLTCTFGAVPAGTQGYFCVQQQQ